LGLWQVCSSKVAHHWALGPLLMLLLGVKVRALCQHAALLLLLLLLAPS
jgi:hypothetical protein